MDIMNLLRIPKFTLMNEVFKEFGNPKFKLGDRNIYYMGHGILISYCERKFEIKGANRLEFGDEGEYAIKLSFFLNKAELEMYYKLKEEKYDFESEIIGEQFESNGIIRVGDTFEKITNNLRNEKKPKDNYDEGESRGLRDGEFVFEHMYVRYGHYTFLFFGKSIKTKMTAFIFNFKGV